MRADLHKYPKEEIAGAFRDYMIWVLANEGTTFVEFESNIEGCTEDKTAREIIRAVKAAADEEWRNK